MPYNANSIEKTVTKEVAWSYPHDTGGISSNCAINKLHVCLKRRVYGDGKYESILNEKLETGQISPKVYENACKGCEDETEYYKIINDLNIHLSLNEIIEKIKIYPKNALLRSEQYIGV